MNFDLLIDRRKHNADKWLLEDCDMLSFSVADMDFGCLEDIQQELKRIADYKIYGYTYRGNEYYKAIIDWNYRHHHVTIKKENIIDCFGVIPNIYACVSALTKENEKVLLHTPCYYPFMGAVKAQNRELVTTPLKYNEAVGQYEIDFLDFEEKIKDCKLYILCSPHNPTGRIWTEEELRRIALLCKRQGVTVIADEIHSDIVFKTQKHIAFELIAKEYELNAISCTAPTKTFNLAGLNISYAYTRNMEIKERVQQEIYNTGFYHNNIFSIAALETAYTKGDKWLDKLMEVIESNKKFLRDSLDKNKVEMIDSQATYLMLLRVKGMSSTKLTKLLLEKAKLLVEDGKIFHCEDGWVRVNIASPRKLLEIAVDRIINIEGDLA
jgi:cystathionine beta-lyase